MSNNNAIKSFLLGITKYQAGAVRYRYVSEKSTLRRCSACQKDTEMPETVSSDNEKHKKQRDCCK